LRMSLGGSSAAVVAPAPRPRGSFLGRVFHRIGCPRRDDGGRSGGGGWPPVDDDDRTRRGNGLARALRPPVTGFATGRPRGSFILFPPPCVARGPSSPAGDGCVSDDDAAAQTFVDVGVFHRSSHFSSYPRGSRPVIFVEQEMRESTSSCSSGRQATKECTILTSLRFSGES
jgi:hypothetical protein